MRNKLSTCAALSCASALALSFGCGRDEPNRDLIARRNAHPTPGQQVEKISLVGCLKGSPAKDMLELHGIEMDPLRTDPNVTSTHPATGVLEGSWVAVAATDQLRGLVGQRVQITGEVREPGPDTVGTTGSGVPRSPSSDRVQAPTGTSVVKKEQTEMDPAARASLSSKAGVPLITPERVDPKGERCQ
jgi:hypothetical protein